MTPEMLDWFKMAFPGPQVRATNWMFATGESFHFIGLCLLFGGLIFVDLRLMGYFKRMSVKAALSYLPFVIAGFLINLASGWLFFTAAPPAYWDNPAFLWKMSFIVLAGLNALWFQIVEHPKVIHLGPGEDVPMASKISAGASLILWLLVLLLGRWLPVFTIGTN